MPTMECTFWAVGQGLFSSGQILEKNGEKFNWVYDCGSQAPKRDLFPAIAKYNEKDIDLLVISHFDADHKNGIDTLLKKRTVKHILLPYYYKWQRLLIAALKGITNEDPLFPFYFDPITYIVENYSQCTKNCEILLLPCKEGDTPIQQFQSMAENKLEYKLLDDKSYSEVIKWQNEYQNIKLLDPNYFIEYQNLAEFIPYNVPLAYLSKKNINITNFENEIQKILNNKTKLTNKDLKMLTATYNKYFGKSGKEKNIISLFFYVRKLSVINKTVSLINTHQIPTTNNKNGNSILYCGDGYLDNPQSLQLISTAMGKQRMDNIFCLQVAHHGAEGNWYTGLADELHPEFSVFSANPNKSPHHPTASVLRDFANYTPLVTGTKNTIKFIFN